MADPKTLQYTAEHEWVLVDGAVATVGITAYAAEKLGDIVFVDLPKAGSSVAEGKVVGEIESTKSVSELFAPVSGEVVQINEAAAADPALINSDPYGEGWLFRVAVSDEGPLLSAEEYAAANNAEL